MKRIPFRIFIIVLITGIIGVAGMVVLKYNIDKLSDAYHEIIDEHVVNQDHMKSIVASLYQHQAQVMNHILADSDEMYSKYEEKEAQLRENISAELTEFGTRMQTTERSRLYHKVYSNFYSYLRNVDIVLELSRSGDKNMATYYVNTTMVGFLENMDNDLDELDDLTISEMVEAKASMDDLIAFSRINEFISILGILIAVIICLFFCVKLTTKLANAKQEADAANQSKSLFLARMSHEIRTPINAIIGMNEMILREEDRQDIIEYGLDVKRSAYTLLSTINDILDLSKIESGKMELVLVEYDVSSLLYDIVNMISMKAKDKGLEVILSVDENVPSRLYGDDVRLRQILINLLNNAVKYTESGSVTLTVKSEIKNQKAFFDFEVKDTGIGIKEEDIKRLFAEFERIEEKRNRNIEGTGLGMSIVTQLLALMDSQLKVQSVYGEGTSFYFSIEQDIVDASPIGDIEEHIKEQSEEYKYEVSFVAPDAKLLVVDDNMVNRKVFVSLLKDLKMYIDEASGGYECIDMLSENTYDLVFLDHMMPDLDGVQTLEKIYELPGWKEKNIPVIALTANALSGAKEMYLELGFADYLSKPFRPEILEEMIYHYLPKDKLKKAEVVRKDTSKKDNKKEYILEELPSINGIDWNVAMIHQPDEESLIDTIRLFLQTIESDASFLEKQFVLLQNEVTDDEILKQYRVKVHAMKSTAALIGAVSLSGIAKMLEDLALKKDINSIIAITPVFLREWRDYSNRLDCFAIKVEEDSKEEVEQTVIIQLLDNVVMALEEMDVDLADELLGKLKQIKFNDESEPFVNKIESAVINLDADAANKVTTEWKEVL